MRAPVVFAHGIRSRHPNIEPCRETIRDTQHEISPPAIRNTRYKSKQTQSGVQIPTGVLLGILEPGTQFQSPAGLAMGRKPNIATRKRLWVKGRFCRKIRSGQFFRRVRFFLDWSNFWLATLWAARQNGSVEQIWHCVGQCGNRRNGGAE